VRNRRQTSKLTLAWKQDSTQFLPEIKANSGTFYFPKEHNLSQATVGIQTPDGQQFQITFGEDGSYKVEKKQNKKDVVISSGRITELFERDINS
jgi:hypothetical protein